MNIEEDYKKHMAPHLAEGYALDPPGFERLRDWTLLLFQITYTKNELLFINEKPEQYDDQNFYEQFSRFGAAIVAYGRCFAKSAPGFISLDANDIFKGQPELKKIHDRMILIRNGVFAHTGRDELMRPTIAVREELDGESISIKHLVTPVLPYTDFPKYLEVLTHVEDQTKIKITNYLDHLEKKLGKALKVR